MDRQSPPISPVSLDGGGEMGALIRAYDWSKTTLGPIADWPQCLRSAVDLILPAQAQIVMFWGADFVALYNDAYAPTIGDKHPRALGRPARENWAELWDDLEPLLQRVRDTGETVSAKDRPFQIERHGYSEEVYFDISYSAVRDEAGAVGGVLCVVNETTERVRAQQALAKTQERLSYALTASGMVGTFDWDIRSDTFYSDARFAALFGVDPSKGEKGTPIADYLAGIHPDDRDRIAEAVNHAIETGAKYAEEYRVLQQDGTIRWIEARGECLYDESGSPLRFPGAVVDITERKRAEDAARDNEQRIRELLEALPAAVYTTDTTGRITFYNQAAIQLSGRRPVLGNDQWCVSWKLYYPDGTPMPHDQCPMALALKEDRPIRGAEAIAERPNGTRVPFIAYPTPLHDASGALVGAVNMLVDMSDRKNAEGALGRLAAIVESSDDAIISKDLDGIIASWNQGAERLFGYRAEEVIGKPVTILIPEERHDEEPGILARIRRGERIDHYETVRRRKGGSLVEVSLTVSPVRDAQGRIIGASKIARDITERKQAERLQRTLVNELKHRVKNILATVQAIARQTFRADQGNSAARETFEARLLALSNAHDLLTRENWSGASLAAIVAEALAPYQRDRFEVSGPELHLSSKAALALTLALHELATNAAKYGALSVPSGRVAITWSARPGDQPHLTFRWQETGGPPVSPPTHKGFGSRLIERSVALELAGEARTTYAPTGVICELSAPLSAQWETAVQAA